MLSRFKNLSTESSALQADNYSFIYLLLLLALGLHVVSGLENHMDVLLWDEANYLNRGTWMFDRIPKVWGPAYSAWYKLLSYFEQDKISLYYLNYKIMTIATAGVAFIFLAVCGVRQWIAFLLCCFLLLSSYNLPVWPKISHYCILIVMMAVIISKYLRHALAKWCVFSLALLITAYARPELFIAFSLCFAVTLAVAAVQFIHSSRATRTLFAFTVLWVLLVCWYYKTPFNSGDSGRSIKVFYQHFSMNYIQWHQLDMSWWLDWKEIIYTKFKQPESISTILKYDGILFWQHVFSNLKNYAGGIASMISQFFIPWTFHRSFPVILGIAGSFLFIFPSQIKQAPQLIKNLLSGNAATFLFLIILVLPGILVCIYAYPRAHYLVINIPLLMLFTALLLTSFQPEKNSIKPFLALLAGTGLVFFAPNADGFDFYQLERKERSLANVQTLRFIQDLRPTDTIRIFDLEGDLSSMLTGKFAGYTNSYLQGTSAPSEIIKNDHIDIVYITPSLLNYKATREDTAFLQLLKQPENHGFYRKKTGNFTPYLLIRNNP